MSALVIGVDWGSSNRRAYLVGENARVIARRQDSAGACALRCGSFAESLDELVGDWRAAHRSAKVFLSGMVGSRSGWQEVAYLDAPLALSRLAAHTVPMREDASIRFVPGICQHVPCDVMRGEETQLLGAWRFAASEGWHVLPGTHSKWVLLENGKIEKFHSFMTGDLYAQLRKQGALAAVTQQETFDEAAFLQGVRCGNEYGAFASLFSVRAGVLLGAIAADQASSRLSGLLIGAEWAAARAFGAGADLPVHIIASTTLAARYQLAASTLGFRVSVHDPDACYARAIEALAAHE